MINEGIELISAAAAACNQCRDEFAAEQIDEVVIYDRFSNIMFKVLKLGDTETALTIKGMWKNFISEIRRIQLSRNTERRAEDFRQAVIQVFVRETQAQVQHEGDYAKMASMIQSLEVPKEVVAYYFSVASASNTSTVWN